LVIVLALGFHPFAPGFAIALIHCATCSRARAASGIDPRLSDVVADIGAGLLDGVGVNAGEVLDVVVQSSLDGQRGKGRIDLECRESVLRTELRGEVAEP
jgi:hypothetical protein